MNEPFCDDGCTMSPQEALAAMRIAHSDEPRATAEEFAEVLETLPAQTAPDFFSMWILDPVSMILGTGYYRFDTHLGISGLARIRNGGLDVLAVVAESEGKGQFRNFIEAAKKRFPKVSVWEDWNPIITAALKRYGFKPAIIEDFPGQINTGWTWISDFPYNGRLSGGVESRHAGMGAGSDDPPRVLADSVRSAVDKTHSGSSAPPTQSPSPILPDKEEIDPFGNGIGWALGKIYKDHLKLPVPDYLKPLVEASEDLVKKEAAKAVEAPTTELPLI